MKLIVDNETMIKQLLILIVLMSVSFTANGQNLFFIGDKSYPSTEIYSLEANSNNVNDLNVAFVKDANSEFVGVRTKIPNDQFHGRLIIYLDDGTVISLEDQEIRDYVDGIASAVYLLQNDDLIKMKNSNINTIRYSLLDEGGFESAWSGNFSSSNKSNIDFSAIVAEFFE